MGFFCMFFPKSVHQELDRFEVGNFSVGRPNGVVLHYTADDNLERVMDSLASKKLGYHLIIERDGTVYQLARLNKKTYHAGRSSWRGFYCNTSFIGVAFMSWGLLKADGLSWSGAVVDKSEIRKDGFNQWHVCTKKQIESMWDVLTFLCAELNISPSNVCSHAECCVPQGRKVDVGLTVPFSMNALRLALTQQSSRGIICQD